MRRWLKLFMRRNTPRMSVAYAKKMKSNLSMLYLFFAWNAAALLAYEWMNQSYPMTDREKKRPALYYARLWQGKDITVVNIDGISLTNSYQIEGIPMLIPDEKDFLSQESNVLNDTADALVN